MADQFGNYLDPVFIILGPGGSKQRQNPKEKRARRAREDLLGSQVVRFDGLSEISMTQEIERISDVYRTQRIGGVDTDPLAPGIIWVLTTNSKSKVFQLYRRRHQTRILQAGGSLGDHL